MTFSEICAVIESYYRRANARLKEQTALNYGLAKQIAAAVCGKLPGLYELYPELFADEIVEYKLSVAKSRLLKYAVNNNARRHTNDT